MRLTRLDDLSTFEGGAVIGTIASPEKLETVPYTPLVLDERLLGVHAGRNGSVTASSGSAANTTLLGLSRQDALTEHSIMGYASLAACVEDLRAHGRLVQIDVPVDPRLEAAAIQRAVYESQGPAVLFSNLKGCRFPAVGNLFGTIERTHFLFRDTMEGVRQLVDLKIDPTVALKAPWRYASLPWRALHTLPRRVRKGPILSHQTTITSLPQIVSWPGDGGPFVTLPLVYTEDPDSPGSRRSNLGMYRVQLGGNDYEPDREVGLHYQIHRGIGVHHAAALRRGEPLRVNVIVGGPPAWTVAAVMPLPEGLSELAFAGALGGRRVALISRDDGLPLPAEADFVIQGVVDPRQTKPEGPFGDHLGYYSLTHPFPVLRVERVWHRPGAIWAFTSVGRPPQEDTSFGQFIHELTGPVIPSVIPGVRAVHAVDEAGVHPLLLAIGSERYMPFAERSRPMELLTQANAILGQGQLSLAKYLLIVAEQDAAGLDIHDIGAFLKHLLERVEWSRDLHFQTETTIDTLDYSGDGLNRGSKVVIAAAGQIKRRLVTEVPGDLRLPEGIHDVRLVIPGVVAVQGTRCLGEDGLAARLAEALGGGELDPGLALVVLADDSAFTAASLRNFLWVTFTRSDPASDIEGVGSVVRKKHWGCAGPLIIDARLKPRHAPPLEDDPAVQRRVLELAARGGPLHGIIG